MKQKQKQKKGFCSKYYHFNHKQISLEPSSDILIEMLRFNWNSYNARPTTIESKLIKIHGHEMNVQNKDHEVTERLVICIQIA